jgi:molybdenum cofactor biosynthesis protein B
MGTHEHKKHAPRTVSIGIITVSTTRSLVDDDSGNWISEQARQEGHDIIYHQVITDDAELIASTLRTVIQNERPQVILTNGARVLRKMM